MPSRPSPSRFSQPRAAGAFDKKNGTAEHAEHAENAAVADRTPQVRHGGAASICVFRVNLRFHFLSCRRQGPTGDCTWAAQPDQTARAYLRAIAGDAEAVQRALQAGPKSN